MKNLQFRSIAPKAPVVSSHPSPSILPCHPPPANPEAPTNSAPKSIIVPSQNYALMQMTGQEGTFSLVAFPPNVSPPMITQQSQSIQNNLKLPIPRYQQARYKGTTDNLKPQKTTATASVKFKISVGSPVVSKPSQDTKLTKEPVQPKDEPSEQLVFINPVPDITTRSPDSSLFYQCSKLEGVPDCSENPVAVDPIPNLQYPPTASKFPSNKPSVSLSQSNQATALPPSITALSPALFTKTLTVAPPTPQGKLPILPLPKVKNTLIPVSNLHKLTQEQHGSPGLTNHFVGASSKTLDPTFSNSPALTSTLQGQAKTTPVLKTIYKPPARKRGRKKKTMDDILAFEARKKRSLSFFRAVVTCSKLKEVDAAKKYRSIRPKPISAMERLPQLASLPAITSEQDIMQGQQLQSPTAIKAMGGLTQSPAPLHLRSGAHSRMSVESTLLHRCPSCNHSFPLKQNLQNHMNSCVCPLSHQAYAHSASLTTRAKLHHSRERPRRCLCCEFCEKSFGYVGVYFSHLREVHKVVLTVEPSVLHHEKHMDGVNFEESKGVVHKISEELQIKCGRCQVVTPTFADMKMHLMHVHGEELHVRCRESRHVNGNRDPETELVKHAAHYWRRLKERRMAKCATCDAEFLTFTKLKKHSMSCHQGRAPPTPYGAGRGLLAAGSAFNCVLCSKVLSTKELLMEHWRRRHRCEQPRLLWEALSSSLKPRPAEPDHSEHCVPLSLRPPDQSISPHSHMNQQIIEILL